ncbi:MAG TPA: radical SAM protein, partial [Desulfosarcina sp.]|nr:radical SAM protein [Desulfosarcina sp.]
IDALSAGGDPGTIPGVARTTPSGKLTVTPRDYGSDDLAEDRPPRYDLVARYRDSYAMSGVGGKMGFVVSAYGCTHRCLFCAIPNITGGRYLPHKTETVIRDIRLLEDLTVIRLVDANTFGDVSAAEALGRGIIDAGLNRRFVADVRSDTVVNHPDLFRLWREAGLETAVIGFEEFRDDRLKEMNKRSGVAIHEAAMVILKDLGIRIVGDFIVSPAYTEADFDALESFVDAHPIDVPLPAILTPIPGTPLYRRYRDAITVKDLAYYTFTNAVMPTRMPEAEFYRTYARLWNHFVGHITH